MSEPQQGRFTLASALLMVAATTPGLILLRTGLGYETLTIDKTSYHSLSRSLLEWLSFASASLLAPLSLAVLALSLWRPPVPRREILRGPGIVACASVALACILPIPYFVVGVWATLDAFPPDGWVPLFFHHSLVRAGHYAGNLIAGAWFGLALASCWHAQQTWTDRFGRVLGMCWIGVWLFNEFYFSVLSPFIHRYFN